MLDRSNRFRRVSATAGVALAAVVLASCGDKTGPNNKQNALRPAGPFSHLILSRFIPFFWIGVVIGIGVDRRDDLRGAAFPREAG